MATLATAFGLLALTLACIGLYGLLAYSVDVSCVLVTGGVVSATPALRDAILQKLRNDENVQRTYLGDRAA